MRNIAKQAFARRLGPCLGSASAAPAAYPHQSPSERGRLCVASVIYLVLRKPGVGNVHFWASWICIILGVAVTILGSIGGCAPPSVCMPAYSPEVLLAARLQRRRIMMQGFTGEGWSLSQLPRMPWASERLGHLSARVGMCRSLTPSGWCPGMSGALAARPVRVAAGLTRPCGSGRPRAGWWTSSRARPHISSTSERARRTEEARAAASRPPTPDLPSPRGRRRRAAPARAALFGAGPLGVSLAGPQGSGRHGRM
jgi:hypothetical protein